VFAFINTQVVKIVNMAQITLSFRDAFDGNEGFLVGKLGGGKNMSGWKRKSIVLLVVGALIFSLTPPLALAMGQDAEYGDRAAGMIIDGILVRPLGIAATIVGGAFFVVSLPFSALGGNIDESAQRLVVDPYKFTKCMGLPPLRGQAFCLKRSPGLKCFRRSSASMPAGRKEKAQVLGVKFM
jgi:hypothetical protein